MLLYVCHLVRGDYNPVVSVGAIANEIHRSNFASVRAEQMRSLLPQAVAEWQAFAASWEDLGLDTFMADGGRYRRRRFGAFSLSADGVLRKAASTALSEPRLQRAQWRYRALVRADHDDVADGACLQSILRLCFSLFDGLTPADRRPASWHTECHQFRIEARPGEQGQPTPEGSASRRRRLGAGDAGEAREHRRGCHVDSRLGAADDRALHADGTTRFRLRRRQSRISRRDRRRADRSDAPGASGRSRGDDAPRVGRRTILGGARTPADLRAGTPALRRASPTY